MTRITADLNTGLINKLNTTIARQRYQMGDARTKRAQKELVKSGLLVKQGRAFVSTVINPVSIAA